MAECNHIPPYLLLSSSTICYFLQFLHCDLQLFMESAEASHFVSWKIGRLVPWRQFNQKSRYIYIWALAHNLSYFLKKYFKPFIVCLSLKEFLKEIRKKLLAVTSVVLITVILKNIRIRRIQDLLWSYKYSEIKM